MIEHKIRDLMNEIRHRCPNQTRATAAMDSGKEVARPPPVRGSDPNNLGPAIARLNWDLALAAVLTAAGVLFVKSSVIHDVLNGLLTVEFGLIGAVLGVVIAGLAIIVAFLTREYANVLMRSEGGPIGDFWPFWFVAGLQPRR